MKRLCLSLLLLLSCGSVVAPQLKLKHTPAALVQAQNYCPPASLPAEMDIETFFGPVHITEPLIIELLHHPAMLRTKEIDQHGPPTYFAHTPTFSRYEHCLGVFSLLRQKGSSVAEQVAGLLHDVSHTVFSHVADHLFKTGNQVNYQDTIHEWYLEKMGLEKLLNRYGLSIEEVNPDRPEFCALEQKSPKLCADRIQYILHTGLVFNRINPEQVQEIFNSLSFEDGQWHLANEDHAHTLAELSLHFTETFWATPENLAWRHWLCNALQQAIARNLITFDDIHFSTDAAVLDILNNSDDRYIKEMMQNCYDPHSHFKRAPTITRYDISEHPKLRAVDPLVQLEGEEKPAPLSVRSIDYKHSLEAARRRIAPGTQIVFN